jgi:hypothetical protein
VTRLAPRLLRTKLAHRRQSGLRRVDFPGSLPSRLTGVPPVNGSPGSDASARIRRTASGNASSPVAASRAPRTIRGFTLVLMQASTHVPRISASRTQARLFASLFAGFGSQETPVNRGFCVLPQNRACCSPVSPQSRLFAGFAGGRLTPRRGALPRGSRAGVFRPVDAYAEGSAIDLKGAG